MKSYLRYYIDYYLPYYPVVIIALVLIGLFFPLKSLITEWDTRQAETARTALQVTTNRDFDYVLKTQQGNLVTDGPITIHKPVKFKELKQSFGSVVRVREVYTMHTQVTHHKGYTSTSTYWSWDRQDSDKKSSKNIEYRNHDFKFSKFNFGPCYQRVSASKILKKPSHVFSGNSNYYYVSAHVRYYYKVLPVKIHAGFIANAGEQGLSPIKGETHITAYKMTAKEIVKSYEADVRTDVIIFTVVYVLLSALLCLWITRKVSDTLFRMY